MGVEEQIRRRLAAILAADVVGYSRLMEGDEAGTLVRLKACRREVIDPAVKRHRGRIVKSTGDGFLIEFPSAVDCVHCAVAIQRSMLERNATLERSATLGDNAIVFRIGINVGDLIIENADIYGEGVNIAARLESLSEPGGILISRSARDQIRGKLPYEFTDQGEHQVKNITRSVRAFALAPAAIAAVPLPAAAAPRWSWSDRRGKIALVAGGAAALAVAAVVLLTTLRGPSPVESIAAPLSTSVPVAPAMSIVVLPFVNASGDADKDAFSEAVTEDLITDLSRISGAFVISSNTTFAYRGKQIDARQAAAELNVRYVLTGSVRQLGEDVRVTASLIDGESGAQIWAERFERTRGDVFALQQEVTGRIARALNLELKEAISRKSQSGAPADLDAEDYAVRAWAEIWNKPQSKATNDAGLQFAEKALSIDPNNAQALATASYAHSRASSSRWSADPPASLRRAIELAEKAVALDPRDADSQYVLSYALRLSGERVRGEEANLLCVALNPNHAPGQGGLGIFSLQDGRLEEAKSHFEQALALSPRDPLRAIWYNFLASIELVSDRFERAVEIANRGIAANPDFLPTNLTLAAALSKLERKADAAAVLERLRQAQPNLLSVASATKRVFQATSKEAEPLQQKYMRYLREAGVPD